MYNLLSKGHRYNISGTEEALSFDFQGNQRGSKTKSKGIMHIQIVKRVSSIPGKKGCTLELSEHIIGDVELNRRNLCPYKFVINSYYEILGTDKGIK